jgi:hypothetical protein
MTRRRHHSPTERTLLLLILLLVSPLTTTPPAPIFVHAERILVEAPAPEEARPAVALVLDAPPGLPGHGGSG